jgi:hypothetical protein
MGSFGLVVFPCSTELDGRTDWRIDQPKAVVLLFLMYKGRTRREWWGSIGAWYYVARFSYDL